MEGSQWLILALGLISLSLGLAGVVQVVGLTIIFVAGAGLLWYGVADSGLVAQRGRVVGDRRVKKPATRPLKRGTRSRGAVRPRDRVTALTGFGQIDAPLNEIVDYIFRDYVLSWHFQLTHSAGFPAEAEESVHRMVAALAARIRNVDWIPYLTTDLVDDVASHVKLFKKAKQALKIRQHDHDGGGKIPDLESMFFDAEVAMVSSCRDLVSTIHQEELNYLQNVAEILLYLLLPEVDFDALPMRSVLREIIANSVLKPTLDLVSEPDFINQTIVWLYGDYKIKHDVFTNAIRYSENIDELTSTWEMANSEISYLRSNDSKGELDSSLKQQLNSLLYLRKVINGRIHQIQSGSDTDSIGIPSQIDWNQMIEPGKLKLFVLPLEVLLKNNIAIGYFIDYMTSIGCQSYIFFYLNVEGWKVSAEQQIQAIELDAIMTESGEENKMSERQKNSLLENMREAAHSIYEEYLSDKANPRLKLDESAVKRLLFKIRTEPPTASWFEEVQEAVHVKLENDERFLDLFRQSYGYVKLLAELDLLKDSTKLDDEADGGNDEFSIYDSLSLNSYDSAGVSEDKDSSKSRSGSHDSTEETWIEAHVIEVSTVKEGGKSYAIYTMLVKISGGKPGEDEVRHVYRRYSDFHALHEKVCSQFPQLSKLNFPSKKTFGNMDKNLLDKRRVMLDAYIKELLKPSTLRKHFGLIILLERFLDHSSSYEKERSEVGSNVIKAAVSVKNSVKTVTSVVTSVPNNLIDSVVDGINKALPSKSSSGLINISDEKVGAAIDSESSDNIPLRILLLFMDEVFDLQERNQWIRRHIVTVLRQLIKAMFGDIVNRRIVDYFAQITSPENLGTCIESFKQSRWPDGYPAASPEPRDENTKMRTRVAARAALLSSFSDDLRRVIGSETSRSGLLMIFHMLQRPVLNKRLGIVILEGILKTLFRNENLDGIFQKLHSRSAGVRNELKNSQRTFSDIRR